MYDYDSLEKFGDITIERELSEQIRFLNDVQREKLKWLCGEVVKDSLEITNCESKVDGRYIVFSDCNLIVFFEKEDVERKLPIFHVTNLVDSSKIHG